MQRGIRAVGQTRLIADHEDLLPVVPAGDCPDAVELDPPREAPEYIGALRSEEIIARVNDGNGRRLFARVGEQMLNVCACSRAHIGKGESLDAASGRAESAEIILLPVDIAAVGEIACFFVGLRKSCIGTDALACRLLVVDADEFFGGACEFRLRIACQETREHLLLSCGCLAKNRDLGRIFGGHAELIVRRRDMEAEHADELAVRGHPLRDLCGELRAHEFGRGFFGRGRGECTGGTEKCRCAECDGKGAEEHR